MNARFSKFWGRLTESMLFLPTTALVLILIADFFLIHNFFVIEVKDGHLYGNVIDILVHGSPTMILAIGMTLVIATGGVDLSVGAIMAISASIAAVMMNPTIVGMNLTDPKLFINNPQYTWMPLWAVIVVPIVVATLCGVWNGVLVSYGRIQPMVATLVL
ncbi:MAG: ABC transporter permease, partial [Isosphaeraceae bacterium]